MEDIVIIGGGPCGLSAAIECGRHGLKSLIIEKHNIVQSIYFYPTNMQFFSTAELLEIGDIPFSSPHDKPFRHEALTYYRRVAAHYKLDIRPYEKAGSIVKEADGTFTVHTADKHGQAQQYQTRHVVVATGYFDHPNELGIPGEDMDKVTHYFKEAHPYTGTRVAIIGGSNSAVDAALELTKAGAHIDIVYRGSVLSEHIKPWVRPLFEGVINKGKVTLHLGSHVTEIRPHNIVITGQDGSSFKLDNDFVLAMTGFRPDRKLLESVGVQLAEDLDKPVFNPETMETNIPGVYVAGVIASGRNANEVFIESGRWHGKLIAEHIIRADAVHEQP